MFSEPIMKPSRPIVPIVVSNVAKIRWRIVLDSFIRAISSEGIVGTGKVETEVEEEAEGMDCCFVAEEEVDEVDTNSMGCMAGGNHDSEDLNVESDDEP